MVRLLGSLVFVMMMLTSCGGGEDTTVTTATTTTAPTTATTTTTTTTVPIEPDVVAITTPPCDLLTADDVSSATGLTAAAGVDTPPISCTFDVGDDTGVTVFVTVEDQQLRIGGAASLFAAYSDGGAEDIPGLGDAAVFSQAFRSLAVDAGGGRYIAVGVSGGYSELAEPRDALVELAAAVLGRL